MSILIKGMEMPTNCWNCPCADKQHGSCEILCEPIWDEQLYRCPLIAVPNHGRLIDESWLKKAMIDTLEALKCNPMMTGQEAHLLAAFEMLRVMLENCPTIIDADKENRDNAP